MALKKINFCGFILLLSDDVRDVFRYYNVTQMHGLSHEAATKRINEGGSYCDGWANLAPHKGMKPFIFLNTKTMREKTLQETALLIGHETTHLCLMLFEIENGENYEMTIDKFRSDFEEQILTDAEEIAKTIMKRLKFPEIHFNLK